MCYFNGVSHPVVNILINLVNPVTFPGRANEPYWRRKS